MELFNEEPCPDCGIKAPVRQIETLGNCERCEIDFGTQNGETLNPDNNIIDRWKAQTTA